MNHPIKNPVSPRKTRFGEASMASLNVLIDLLIPASRDRRMPAAKDLLLYADISDLPAQDRALFESGLAQIEARSMQQHHIGFAQLQAVDHRPWSILFALKARSSFKASSPKPSAVIWRTTTSCH